MHFSRKTGPLLGLATLAALGLAAARPAAAQGLDGQSVDVRAYEISINDLYHDDGIETITPAGATFTGLTTIITVTPNQIVFHTDAADDGIIFSDFPFNGNGVSEVGPSPVTITGVTVDSATNFTGFDASDVTFDGTDVYFNLENLTFNSAQNITLDLTTAASPAPEPSSVMTFGFVGLFAAGLILRARKRRAA